jgi:hypothetical protein
MIPWHLPDTSTRANAIGQLMAKKALRRWNVMDMPAQVRSIYRPESSTAANTV